MKIKGFFWYVWCAQELTGLIFVSLGALVGWNFVQIEKPYEFIQLMLNLFAITVVVNIITFIGILLFDSGFYLEISKTNPEDPIISHFVLGIAFYFLILLPIFIWIAFFTILELLEIGLIRFSGFTEIYYKELILVFLITGFFSVVIWLWQKFSSVFEFTIIKRNKNVGEKKYE